MNFNKHINCHHDIWRYVYFLIYLETKDSKEYNGIEQAIANLVDQNSTKWMPNHKTIYLAREKIIKDDKVESDVGTIIANSRVKLKTLKKEAKDMVAEFKDVATKVHTKISK